MIENEKKWLVKSANRVWGPFSLNEVIQRVREKQVSIIDEVRTPEQRWTYIRDSLLFLEVVKEIRADQAANSENTVNSKTTTLQTRTSDIEKSSMTPTEDLLISVKNDLNAQVKEVSYDEENLPKNSKSDRIVYTTTYDPERKKNNQKNLSNLSVVLLVIVVAIGAGFFGYKKYLDQKFQSQIRGKIQKIYSLKSVGLYQKAYDLFKTLPFEAVTEDLEKEIWPIQLQNGNQPYAIRKSAEDRLKKTNDEKIKKSLNLVVFLGLMAEGDPSNFQQAKKVLQDLIVLEPNSDFLKMNDALIDIRMNRLTEANKKLKSLITSPVWGYSLYARAQIMIAYIKRNLINEFTARTEIENFLSDVSDYFKSNHLFLTTDLKIYTYYILTQLNQTEPASIYLDELLDAPLLQDGYFSNEIMVDWSYYRASKEDKSICLESFPEQSTNYKVLLGRFLCHFGSNKEADAKQILNTVKQNFGLTDQALNLESQVLFVNNDTKLQELASLKEWQTSQSALFIKAYLCMSQNNAKCFKEIYQILINKEVAAYKIPIMQLAAEFANKNGSTVEALGYLREIINIEPYYMPALILRDSIESQKL